MHELAIAESIVHTACGAAGGRSITGITLVIGELSGVVEEAIRFCFGAVSEGTGAADARLVVVPVPAKLRCRSCSEDFLLDGSDWVCPRCGALGADLVAGREFYLESIEVEDREKDPDR